MTPARLVRLFSKREPAVTGTSRYGAMLALALERLGWRVDGTSSETPWPAWFTRAGRRFGVDPAAFWATYPLAVPAPRDNQVLHLTVQTLATGIAFRRPRAPIVVTVHDILPYTLRHDASLRTIRHPLDLGFYRLALRGLGRADVVLADSSYTADELVRLRVTQPERIRVVPLGVDHDRFSPQRASNEFLRRHGLSADERYAVYVGSEDPRKNLSVLVEAFAAVAPRHPDLRLLKIGAAHHLDQRARLIALAKRLGIVGKVRFLDEVPEDDLASFYALASVCVVPSLHEGFGLPVLEAMACGVPVVCANRTSLREVAGEAASLVEPTPTAVAAAIDQLLSDPAAAGDLRERGLRRAAEYTWARTAELTVGGYERAQADWVMTRG